MKRLTFLMTSILLLFSVCLAQGNSTTRDALRSAKTLHISVPEGSTLDLKAEIAKKLNKWGKLTIVTSPETADLVLRVEQTRGFSAMKGKGARGAALLTDRRSGVELWSTSEGGDWSMAGYSIGRVARKIADKLIKFYDKEIR